MYPAPKHESADNNARVHLTAADYVIPSNFLTCISLNLVCGLIFKMPMYARFITISSYPHIFYQWRHSARNSSAKPRLVGAVVTVPDDCRTLSHLAT